MPNNRQLALLIWAAVALAFALRSADVRKSLKDVARMLLQPAIFVPIATFFGLVTANLMVGSVFGIWNSDLATDSAFWVIGSGFVLLFNFDRATKSDHYFRQTLGAILGLTILVELLLEISILPLPVELALVPITTLLVGVEVVAAREEQNQRVAGCAKGLLTVLGLGLLTVGLVRAATDFAALDLAHLGRQALLPIWMTAGLLPFVYLLALYAKYESVGNMIDWRSKQGWRQRTIVKLAVVREYGVKARSLGQFTNPAAMKVAEANSWREARETIRAHRSQLSEKEADERAAAARLEEFAGVEGVDEDGSQLDRREFEQTCAALRWLHSCHMGWWRRENRYTEGLLDRITTATDSHGLTPGAGYNEVVSDDGLSWYAWRRTTTGWVFAIAAAGSPPDQWLYDGADPPDGPPFEDPKWGDVPFGGEVSLNWD